MRLTITTLTFAICLGAVAQEPFDKFTVDTFYLKDFHAKKVISYKLHSVTFLVDYNDFMKMYTVFWKRHKKGNWYREKAKREGKYYNRNGELQWQVMDSMYRHLKSAAKKNDTIYITHTPFNKVGMGTWNNFFPELIENNRCAVLNSLEEKQSIVIRHKGSIHRGFLNAWAGRRYFLVGQTNFFIEGTDWIS